MLDLSPWNLLRSRSIFLVGLLAFWMLACVPASGKERESAGPDPRVIALLKKMDTNADGRLEAGELSLRQRVLVRRLAKQYGHDPEQSLTIAKFTRSKAPTDKPEQLSAKRGKKRAAGAAADTDKPQQNPTPDTSAPSTKSGPQDAAPRNKGFGISGRKFGASRETGGGKGFGSRSTRLQVEATEKLSFEEKYGRRVTRYVKGVLRRYDKNQSGALELAEWRNVEWSSPPKPSDTNGDQRLSKIELCERTAKRWNITPKPGIPRDPPRPSKGVASRQRSSNARPEKTYRYVSPYERLPADIPDWFREKDQDRDGQIAMREFASKWSQSQVERFRNQDHNGDGFLSPQEAR